MSSQVVENSGKKVFVGLSGGVDSAVSAALLLRAGYDVTGVFIKVWQPDWIECSWKEDRREAMRVAAHLGIPFVTLDLEKEYKEGVIDYMIAEYRAGRTPNPDVMCNREVKFGGFWQWAHAQGARYVATGHYSRSMKYEVLSMKEKEKSHSETKYALLTGKDANKDQSYFLWTLRQGDLEHILFPVGDIPKPEVRKLAKKLKLPNADRKDSQGLCFIGKVDVKEFLRHYITTAQGNVLNESGEVIGTHPGALLFTIGERHGFTITERTPHDDPYYVVSKDAEKNILTVSNKKSDQEKVSPKVEITRCNWINEIPVGGTTLKARGRYRQGLSSIEIIKAEADTAIVRFEHTDTSLTPGQSLVIYDGERCVGGGVLT
ncbi:MAG: tRNA 2-thiouridine(34) synthase MnmA [Patescibacteria group bacterium]